MIEEIQELLDRYWAWLRDRTSLRQVGDWVEITTPYLDRHNDYLQIYARRDDGSFILTDDGYVINDLRHSGCSLDSPKRSDLLQVTLNGFGVQLNGDKLELRASPESFALRKHSLVQAMLAVNDLFYTAEPYVTSLFYEDVVEWLDAHEIRYSPGVHFTGKSGYDHKFDFLIPKSRRAPERVLQTVNRPSKDTAQSAIMKWVDTREVRPADSRAYVLLNDSQAPVPPSVVTALLNYEIVGVLWSERERRWQELAA
ncbi:MAG: DUF1829 domain-containing protein [Armatimonadetes bacterium]|nr:DUF1829 domain-containing protein [Armatimonadota bacterium]